MLNCSNAKGRSMRVTRSGIVLLAMVIGLVGCTKPAGPSVPPVVETSPTDGEHDHATEHQGPHNGQIVDLGRDHEYHAEVVDDDTGIVSVFILDRELQELPIEAASLAVTLVVDGTTKSFELFAVGPGKSSRFDCADKGLFEALHLHGASGKLRVTIEGTPYSGEVTSHHADENGHNHAH